MIQCCTNIYGKCLPLLVKHDPLCEESHHLEEEKKQCEMYFIKQCSLLLSTSMSRKFIEIDEGDRQQYLNGSDGDQTIARGR